MGSFTTSSKPKLSPKEAALVAAAAAAKKKRFDIDIFGSFVALPSKDDLGRAVQVDPGYPVSFAVDLTLAFSS